LRRVSVLGNAQAARQIGAPVCSSPVREHTIMRQFARYGVVGIANTIVGLGCIFAAKAVFGLSDLTANALGFTAGVIQSYLLNRSWTFERTDNFRSRLWRFVAVVALGYLLNLGVLLVAIDRLGMNGYLGQVLGTAAYALFVFFGSRYFAFGQSTEIEKDLR
jgi:putative flippase GtrA